MIRISPIRVVGPDNEQIGVMDTHDALRMAQEQGLDLVEVVPDNRPPVCKIMDYGKYKYDLSKRESNNKQASNEIKEIRLGRSIKIDPHDVGIRVNQARRFLMAGHKVQITQRFKGREMMHKELGLERLAEIVDDLSDIAKVEMAPRWAGRSASLVMSPDRNKVETAKRKLEKERAEAGKAAEEEQSLEELEAQVAAQNLEVGDDDEDGDTSTTVATEGSAEGKPDAKAGKKKGQGKKEKKKGPKDDRSRNPIDDEMAALLGED